MKAVLFFMSIAHAWLPHAGREAASTRAGDGRRQNLQLCRTCSSDQLAAATCGGRTYLQRAGISVEWIDCRVPGRAEGAACTEPLLAGRDFDAEAGRPDAAHDGAERIVALGESMLDREQRGGVLMTVDLFPVRSDRRSAHRPSCRRCSAAPIAHEIGHLLLGSAEHPRLGPHARALVARRAARPQAGTLGLFAREAAQMRQTLRGTVANRGLSAAPIAPIAPAHLAIYCPSWQQPDSPAGGSYGRSCMSAPASAQTNRIGGVVRDETGATIRGAIVRAETGGGQHVGAPVTLTTATDDRGRFVFVVSRSGEWRLTFEAPGFEPMTISAGVRLTGPAPNLDIKLERRESPEAFGALAGVDSKVAVGAAGGRGRVVDEGRHDQAIAAYREIKAGRRR